MPSSDDYDDDTTCGGGAGGAGGGSGGKACRSSGVSEAVVGNAPAGTSSNPHTPVTSPGSRAPTALKQIPFCAEPNERPADPRWRLRRGQQGAGEPVDGTVVDAASDSASASATAANESTFPAKRGSERSSCAANLLPVGFGRRMVRRSHSEDASSSRLSDSPHATAAVGEHTHRMPVDADEEGPATKRQRRHLSAPLLPAFGQGSASGSQTSGSPGRADAVPSLTNVFVGNLPLPTEERGNNTQQQQQQQQQQQPATHGFPRDMRARIGEEVRALFARFGEVLDVRVFQGNGVVNPYAFVRFADEAAGRRAVSEMNAYVLRGSRLEVAVGGRRNFYGRRWTDSDAVDDSYAPADVGWRGGSGGVGQARGAGGGPCPQHPGEPSSFEGELQAFRALQRS